MPSKYELTAYKALNDRWIKFDTEQKLIPWRQYRADIYIRKWFKKIVIEIDWEYHDTIKFKIHDIIRDIIFMYHWYTIWRVSCHKDIKKQIDLIIDYERLVFWVRYILLLLILLYSTDGAIVIYNSIITGITTV